MSGGNSTRSFHAELASLLNRYGLDDTYNTPDFVLAGLVAQFLQNWGVGLEEVRRWHGWPTLTEKHAAMFQETTEGGPHVG